MRQGRRFLIPAFAVLLAVLSGGQTLYPPQCQLDASFDGDPDTVIAACAGVIQGGGDPAVYGYQGYALYRKGEYDRAIADYDEVIRREPYQTWIYPVRGMAYDAMGDHQRALQDLYYAVEIGNWTDGNLYNLLGIEYRHNGYYGQAILAFDYALYLFAIGVDNPGPERHARWLNNRGMAELGYGDVTGANADFAEAKQIDPEIRCTLSPTFATCSGK